jgi:hypothetical protein
MSGIATAPAVHVSVICMPAHGHSMVPCFDGNALNLCLYFDKVESLSINTGLNEEGKIRHALHYASREDNKLWSTLPEAEAVRGHLSVSLLPPSSPTLPLFICTSPIPLYHPQGPHSKADNFPEVDSPNVIDFPCHHLLLPQQHWTSLGRIGTGLRDTMVPSAITWTPIYGGHGTRRLGTVILHISFVD